MSHDVSARRWETVDGALGAHRPAALSRRSLIGRAAALGVGLPLLTRSGLSAQKIPSPAAPPPSGEPVTIGAKVLVAPDDFKAGDLVRPSLTWDPRAWRDMYLYRAASRATSCAPPCDVLL